ncbi:MAG: tetratricopeptide repeat protein [Planctomycetota bacterium]
MTFEPWRILFFAATGLLTIVLFSLLGTNQFQEKQVDRHTGKALPRMRTADEALDSALRGASAPVILDRVQHARKRYGANDGLREAEAVLRAELDETNRLVPGAHPLTERIRVDRAQVEQYQNSLDQHFGERMLPEDLVTMLRGLESDRAIGEATHSLWVAIEDRIGKPAVSTDFAAHTCHQRLDDNEEVTTEEVLAIAHAFAAEGRGRAQRRWLLIAFERAPRKALSRNALVTAYLAQSRTKEAFAVLGSALAVGVDDIAIWKRRMEMSGWFSRPDLQAEAIEGVLRHEPTPELRERAIDIYRYVGQLERAYAHAVVLARGTDDRALMQRPVRIALENGRVDDALGLLEDLAKRDEEPTYWSEQIVTIALQDLRIEHAVSTLEQMVEDYPRRGYDKQLEVVYRRINDREGLVALLEKRLAGDSANRELEQEVLSIYVSLGRRDRVRAILRRQAERITDPYQFFVRLPEMRKLGVKNLEFRAMDMVESEDLKPEDVEFIAAQLYFYLDESDYRQVAWTLASRHVEAKGARALFITIIDSEPTPEARALMASRAAAAHPDDGALLQVWADRAAWAGLIEEEVKAREAIVAAGVAGADNHQALGDLYEATNRHEEAVAQWRILVERDGIMSDATLRLVGALFHLKRVDEAMAWLEKRAAAPDSDLEDRLFVANELFGAGHVDRALVFYGAVLEEDPAHPQALLRAGQIRSWSSDPHGAIPLFLKRLEVSDEQSSVVHYYLGEAYWGTQDAEKGRRYHGLAVPALRKLDPRTPEQEAMLAKALIRLGRLEEAQPLFESLLASSPNAVDFILDYADAMVVARRPDEAMVLVERAQRLEPNNARALRLQAQVHMSGRQYREAVPVLKQTLEKYGPDAGVESDLGYALELSGDWQQAVAAYERSLQLQPSNRDISASRRRLSDLVSDMVGGFVRFRKAGEDRTFKSEVHGGFALADDQTHVYGGFGFNSLSGRAAAIDNGATDVETNYASIRLAVSHRANGHSWFGGGIHGYPGAGGTTPIGAWASFATQASDPFRSLKVQLHYNDLFNDPAAAASLEGRSSGGAVTGYREFGKRAWVSMNMNLRELSIVPPGGARVSDGYFDGNVSVGFRAREGSVAVSEGLNTHTAPPGPSSADLRGEPQASKTPSVNVWVQYQALRLLDDEELSALLPIGERFDYVSGSARIDHHVGRGFGWMALGTLGADIHERDPFWELTGAFTWRPRHALEVFGAFSYGIARGRSDDDSSSVAVRVGVTYRW